MQPVILDTDVTSLIHKGKLTGPLATRLIGRKPLITFVTFGELTQWTEIRDCGNLRCRACRLALRDTCPVLPGDEAVAATWGKLSAAGRKAGKPQPVNDMWIAACCLTYDLPLATLSLKDYEYFKDEHDLRILGEE